MRTKRGKVKFSIDSSLLFQLGEQLVAKPSVALSELVKNAYDADATKVTVTFKGIGKLGGMIQVEDDGHGMTFEEMQKTWMRIATARKRMAPMSRIYCRPLTGAKGVGRFAARRLGNKLTLQSIAERDDGTKEKVMATFDWEKSFLPGQDLVKVPVSYARQKVEPESATGVSLLIEGARDAWTEEEIGSLRSDLFSLQSPYPDLVIKPKQAKRGRCLPDPGFDINLVIEDAGELEKLSGGLGEAFLEAAWARLNGSVDSEGKAHYDVTIQRIGEKYKLVDNSNDYSGLENAHFRIYFLVYRSEYFKGFDFKLQDARTKGREEGGVRIYVDGFRVFPYGDPGDDWLQLDQYAAKNIDMATSISPPKKVLELAGSIPGRPFLLIPKNNQVFGVVAISQREHSDIEINISRERLIETPTVARLRRFVQNGIYWMTLKYAAFVAEQKAERRIERRQTVPEIIEDVKAAISSQTEIPEEKRRLIIWTLDKAKEQVQEEEEERISEISMLRILASAGTTLTLMNHQLQALIGAVSQIEQDLKRLRPEVPKRLYDQYDDIVAQVSEWYEMVGLQVSQLGFLLSPESRRRRKMHPLYEIVENVRKPMSYYMKKHGVVFENNVARNLHTPSIYKAELYAILINVLSNSLKAVYGQPVRRVAVEAERSNNTLFIRMMDTGVGLPAERREISFKPFVTTSLPNPVLGIGTGLGLKVVRDILELYAGTARFIDIQEPWKTCIEIVLPERGGIDDD
jgi:signal transduction histidine kinase